MIILSRELFVKGFGRICMDLHAEIFTLRGCDNGKNWSVRIERPVFEEGRIKAFYASVCEAVCKRAKTDGLNIFAYITVTFFDPQKDRISLYTDLICLDGKEVVYLKRISDNREGGLCIPPPKRRMKCWYIRNGAVISCENRFIAGMKCRLSSYKGFFEEREEGLFP